MEAPRRPLRHRGAHGVASHSTAAMLGRCVRDAGRCTPTTTAGLEFDVRTLMARRSALGLLGVAGLAALAGCTDGASSTGAGTGRPRRAPRGARPQAGHGIRHGRRRQPGARRDRRARSPVTAATARTCSTTRASCASDLRSSIGTSTTTAAGVPLTVNLTVLDCRQRATRAMAGVAVYAWHCDAQGRYSMYSPGVEDENYLRGVQPTDDERHGERSPRSSPAATRPLAAHPLRGLPQHRRGDERRADRQDQPDRAAPGGLRGGLRRRRRLPGQRVTTSRAPRSPATWCSATTAASTSSRR